MSLVESKNKIKGSVNALSYFYCWWYETVIIHPDVIHCAGNNGKYHRHSNKFSVSESSFST